MCIRHIFNLITSTGEKKESVHHSQLRYDKNSVCLGGNIVKIQ